MNRPNDNDDSDRSGTDYVTSGDMLAELREDNAELATWMREAHALCAGHGDVATASLIESLVDEAEERVWFLFEVTHNGLRE
jgi:starvation-inducible DNA-binding protein